MKDHLFFIVVHALRWALLYGAFMAGSDGAARVLVFFTWAMAVLVPFSLMDKAVQEGAKQPATRQWTRTLGDMQGWVQLGAMVWFGWFWTAGAWLLVMACAGARRVAVDKLRAKQGGAA